MGPVIVTLTANPSLDHTALLAGPLTAQSVNHVLTSSSVAGGRGVHLAATLHRAGRRTLAILPAHHDDPIVHALRDSGLPHRLVPIDHRARTTVTVTNEGASTIIREAGLAMPPEAVTAMMSAVMGACPGASWLTLCGSLPPGAPADLYPRMTRMAQRVGAQVAVQTSGRALSCVLEHTADAAPDLLTLNARQFAEATGVPLEHDDGYARVVSAARHVASLLDLGIKRVLVTLGEHGAISASANGVWYARTENAPVITAVGRGAAATAGWLMACEDGAAEPDRLARALAYAVARGAQEGGDAPDPAAAAAVAVTLSELTPA